MKTNKKNNKFENHFEDWEYDAELFYKKDWKGLLELRLNKAKNNPENLYAQSYLGEAYVLNKIYETAIEFMYKWHTKEPSNYDFQHVILDALFALGKNENDIKWIEKPIVIRLTKEIIDSCYDYLRKKRKSRWIHELFDIFITEGYVTFNPDELLDSLKKDDRFIISNDAFQDISVVRKKRIK